VLSAVLLMMMPVVLLLLMPVVLLVLRYVSLPVPVLVPVLVLVQQVKRKVRPRQYGRHSFLFARLAVPVPVQSEGLSKRMKT
jgi:hypothetical protein